MKKLTMMILLAASSAAMAADMGVAGLTIGAPLPPCERPRGTASCLMFKGYEVAPGWEKFEINANVPMVSAHMIVAYTFDGTLVHVWFLTDGLGSQEGDFQALTEKYGKPTKRRVVRHQNAMGAKFSGIEATWIFRDLRVEFDGLQALDYGSVHIFVPKFANVPKEKSSAPKL